MTYQSNIVRDCEDLASTLIQNRDLGITGWRNCDYTAENFEDYRAQLFKAVDQYRAAKRFLLATERSAPGKGQGSYSLKHFAEDFCETYISNGALIAAALTLGIDIERLPDSPNCRIGVKAKRRARR